jgi:selenide,water dikinase
MGTTDIIGVLIFLAVDPKMPINIASKIMYGFQEFCTNDGTTILGGQTIQNPWPLIGGEAMGISKIDKIIYSTGAKVNDTLVLTKPLGIQPIMAAYRIVRDEDSEFAELVYNIISNKDLKITEKLTIKSMITSNKPVAEVMNQIPVNAATDITGFGLIGHAEEMLIKDKSMDINITKLPIFKGAIQISELCSYGLQEGRAAETAGGMLLSVSSDNLDLLLSELKKRNITPRIVGEVKTGTGKVTIDKNSEIEEVKVV